MTDDGLRPAGFAPCYVVTWPGWDEEEFVAHHASHAEAVDDAASVLERMVDDASDHGGLLDADELLNLAAEITVVRNASPCWEASCSGCGETVAEFSHHTTRADAEVWIDDGEWLLLAGGRLLCPACTLVDGELEVEDRRPGPGQQALL